MRFQSLILSTVLAAAALVSTTAQAGEPWKLCADFQFKAKSALIVTQTCSDAAYVRRDQEEADVICVMAANATGEAAELYGQVKADTASPLLVGCAKNEEPRARQLLAAMDWQDKILKTLQSSAPAPGPFRAD